MKKSIAFILCFSILLSTFIYQIPGVSASEKSVHILHDGKQINELTIQQNEKEELTADVIGIGKTDYQWQLLLDHQNSVWVNIYDKTDRECEVSYALLKNLLDDAGSTYIRCSVTKGSETFYSEAVCVTVAPAYATQSQVISFAKAELVQNAAREAAATLFSMSRDAGSEYVTVTIKYLDLSSLDGNESAIYSPYTATIEKGTNFNQNVVSPTFLGFAPIYAKDSDGLIDDDASTIWLDLENVTENVEIKVYYEPIEVNFAIRYFFQNINDDLYTENVRLYHADKAKTGVPLLLCPAWFIVSVLTTNIELTRDLMGYNKVCDYLAGITEQTWKDAGENPSWVRTIWDIAAPAILDNPDCAEIEIIPTPIFTDQRVYAFDSTRHKMMYLKSINREKVFDATWKILKSLKDK